MNSSWPFFWYHFFSFFSIGFKIDRDFWRACNQQQLQVRGDLSEIRSGMGLMVALCTCTHPSYHCDGWPIGESIQCIVIFHFLKGANYARLPSVLIMAFSQAQSPWLSSALTLISRAITALLFTLPGREEELLNSFLRALVPPDSDLRNPDPSQWSFRYIIEQIVNEVTLISRGLPACALCPSPQGVWVCVYIDILQMKRFWAFPFFSEGNLSQYPYLHCFYSLSFSMFALPFCTLTMDDQMSTAKSIWKQFFSKANQIPFSCWCQTRVANNCPILINFYLQRWKAISKKSLILFYCKSKLMISNNKNNNTFNL